nr:hypothetical protein [Actinacidiphila glaucinigra]
MPHTPDVAVASYSPTGTIHCLAETVAAGAAEAGADVRLLRVAELAPQAGSPAPASPPPQLRRRATSAGWARCGKWPLPGRTLMVTSGRARESQARYSGSGSAPVT